MFRQELSVFGTQERKVTIMWGSGT